MAYTVHLTHDAERDLEDIIEYIAVHDAPGKAAKVLDRIEKIVSSLAQLPQRGVYPKELAQVGIREYREVFFKPYRLIYGVIGMNVYVYLIADGRRDMQPLLERRLLDPGMTREE